MATTQPVATETVVEPTTSRTSPSEILVYAQDTWRARDWNAMSQFATGGVVSNAQAAAQSDTSQPYPGPTEDLDSAWECSLAGSSCSEGLWTCDSGGQVCRGEILYGDDDGQCCASIYRVTIEELPDGTRLTGLEFGGDAG